MARGDYSEHSDVDRMVIMPEDTDCKTAEIGIMGELRGSMLPKDVLANTPDSFARAVDDVGSVQHSVREDGVMLYGWQCRDTHVACEEGLVPCRGDVKGR